MDWLQSVVEDLLEQAHDELVAEGETKPDETQTFERFTGVTDHRSSRLQFEFEALDTFSGVKDRLWVILDVGDGTAFLYNGSNRFGSAKMLDANRLRV